jgi:hypothetical protein
VSFVVRYFTHRDARKTSLRHTRNIDSLKNGIFANIILDLSVYEKLAKFNCSVILLFYLYCPVFSKHEKDRPGRELEVTKSRDP